jgi:hypothetical protein
VSGIHLINEQRHYRAPIQQYNYRLLEGFLVVTDSRKLTFSLQNSAVIKKKGTGAMSGNGEFGVEHGEPVSRDDVRGVTASRKTRR